MKKLKNVKYRSLQCVAVGLAAVAGQTVLGQTNTPTASAPGMTNNVTGLTNGATELGSTTVVGSLNQARTGILTAVGATVSSMNAEQIQAIAQGDAAPMSQLILRLPGVAQDSAENGDLHVRGEHGNLQYRIDDVLLPEGIAGFGLELDPRFVQNLQLITGALPAEYGFRTAGVIDIQTKDGAQNPGGEASIYAGSYDTFEPSFEFGGGQGKWSYFFDGSFEKTGLGVENPTPSSTPIHDYSQQFKSFGYGSYIIDDTSRLTLMGSASYTDYEVPNTPNLPAGTNAAGVAWASNPMSGLPTAFSSSALNEQQKEENYYVVAAYQKSTVDLDFQLSTFLRRSEVQFTPDSVGDLYFNGVAAEVDRTLYSAGLQLDASEHHFDKHTIRFGGSFLETGVASDSTTTVFNVAGGTPSGAPFTITDNHPLYGQFFGVYLQDEWKIAAPLTLNYGARFDVYSSSFDDENQVSPRINLVYKPFTDTTLHAGYARYFTPPPVEDVSGGTVNKFAGTSNEALTDEDSPVKAERANYYDVGISQKLAPGLQVGLDGYYKIAQNQLDDGLFGQTLILSAFNYERGEIHGLEATASYTKGGFSTYANLANTVAKGENWNSSQFLFAPGDVSYVKNHWIYLDHDQKLSGSYGMSYLFKEGKSESTLVYIDALTGTGLRQDGGGVEPASDGGGLIPNGATVPSYYSINMGGEQSIRIDGKQYLKVRVDVVNVTDNTYELRSGSGVGVNAAQYGERRGIFGTLSYSF
jgi:outer membrane receptor protein involved in Fe transport